LFLRNSPISANADRAASIKKLELLSPGFQFPTQDETDAQANAGGDFRFLASVLPEIGDKVIQRLLDGPLAR